MCLCVRFRALLESDEIIPAFVTVRERGGGREGCVGERARERRGRERERERERETDRQTDRQRERERERERLKSLSVSTE